MRQEVHKAESVETQDWLSLPVIANAVFSSGESAEAESNLKGLQ